MHGRSSILDAIRAVAALVVMFGHLRSFIFADYPTLVAPSSVTKIFYYLTGFGHEAVIVFFVLSGYLVGGSVISKNQFSWIDYLLKRLSRLWIVLVPVLLLTLMINSIGYHAGGELYLNGDAQSIASAPTDPVELGGAVFLGNITFLQTVYFPVYGDNGPLWSLANEFWYYILFPLLYISLGFKGAQQWWGRGGKVALIGLIFSQMPLAMIEGFGVWLLGALIHYVIKNRPSLRIGSIWVGAPMLMVAIYTFHLARVGEVRDIILGLAFVAAMPFLVTLRVPFVFLKNSATVVSNFSYTLYLIHFPIVAFIWYMFLGSKQVLPSIDSYLVFTIIALGVVSISFVFYYLFERNTDKVRHQLKRKIKVYFP
tara:strand:+ start:1403 stop:2509 length:1107 start_codon:yes stop_codon:yes gene_type:complete